jgi:hypothetical protein
LGYLLDEGRPNIFTLSVGNLTPGMEVVISIDLVMLLDLERTSYIRLASGHPYPPCYSLRV